MSRDIHEVELHTWDDFLDYCRGACVAPATVFVYILGCQVERDMSTVFRLSGEPQRFARDMSIFCYLIHILRDLQTDVRKNSQLLSIPRDLLAQAGLNLEEFKQCVEQDKRDRIHSILRFYIGQIEKYGALTTKAMAVLSKQLGEAENSVLSTLISAYSNVFHTVRNRLLS
jgi:phytoene synthase